MEAHAVKNRKKIEKDYKEVDAARRSETEKLGLIDGKQALGRDYDVEFAILGQGGNAYVMKLDEPDVAASLMKFPAFEQLHRDDWYLGNKGNIVYPSKWWLKCPTDSTQIYRGGLVFKPPGSRQQNVRPDEYNLFAGFLVEPDPSGSCQLFYDLLQDVWCRDDAVLSAWLQEWFFHIIRFPGDLSGVALGVSGGQGDGKNFPFEYMMRTLLGDMLGIVTNQNVVLGNHNEILIGKLLMVYNKSAFAKDVGAFQKIKGLTTDPSVVINPKFKSPITIDNYARSVFISNHDHFLHMEFGDRRNVVFHTRPTWRGTTKFAELKTQWESGGAERFMYDALNHQFRQDERTGRLVVNTKLATEWEADQHAESRSLLKRFLVELLTTGNFDFVPVRETIDDTERKDKDGFRWLPENLEFIRSQFLLDMSLLYHTAYGGGRDPLPTQKAIKTALEELIGPTVRYRPKKSGGGLRATVYALPGRNHALQAAYDAKQITLDEMKAAHVHPKDAASQQRSDETLLQTWDNERILNWCAVRGEVQ